MENKYEEIIQFVQRLVQIPSQGEIDGERVIAYEVFDKLKTFGFKPEMIGAGNRPSVICNIKKGGGKIIWLESCLDAVSAGNISNWEYPPFEGKIVGNKLFGRGAADSKIGIALFCYLAKELMGDSHFDGSIFLGFDADEQAGNFTGIKEVIKKAPKADVCILGYQGINEISIGARGWLRIQIISIGKSAHTGSRANKGINAIHSMGRVINAITSLNFDKQTEPFFEFGSSLNVSQINGGAAINVVPDKCEAKIEIRLIPSQTKEETLKLIKNKLDKLNIRYELEVLQYEPAYLTNSKDFFVVNLEKIASAVLGKKIPIVASGPGSVGNVVSRLGIPIINGFGVDNGNVHALNEWIDISTVPQVFEIYKEAVLDYSKGR